MSGMVKIIKKILLVSLLAGGIVFFYPSETFVTFGQIAWYALLGVMCIRPLHDIFPKCKLFSFLLKFRREIGIIAGVLGILHGIGSFIEQHNDTNKAYLELLAEPYTWDYQFCVFWGMLAALVSLPLILTSNGISTSLLKQNWKRLQRLSYVMLVIVGIHIFVFTHESGSLVFVGIWLAIFILAWVLNKNKPQSTSAGPKRLCVPCGYIYDESVGDPDGGIVPGTSFEDIPDDWRCPVCGVGKSDFIYLVEEREIYQATIVSIHELNPTVIELNISTQTPLSFRPGQFLSLGMQDEKGEFQRSYSIVEINGNLVKFLIKIKKDGRAGQWFLKAQVGDTLTYTGVSGKFILQQTVSPKVFIATGTGLAPIYAMLKDAPRELPKALYFSVSFKEDLFYFKELQAFTDVDLHIHVTRESVPGLQYGRVNFEAFGYPLNTEFYICGNASVLSSAETTLRDKGYTLIYFEKF